jgi:hypothetical protein
MIRAQPSPSGLLIMKFCQSIRRVTLPTLALAAATAGGLAWAGPDNVPFKASVKSQEVLTIDADRCPGTFLVGTTTGKGNASHMGAISVVASDCPVTQDGVNFVFSNGLMTIAAANGDTLTASYQGSLQPIAGTGLHSLTGIYSVTGGTGRFAGAQGKGELQGKLKLPAPTETAPAQGQLNVTGVLSYSIRP